MKGGKKPKDVLHAPGWSNLKFIIKICSKLIFSNNCNSI